MLIGMKGLSYNSKRALVGVALVPFVFLGLNALFGWHLFGSFDKRALVLSGVLLFVVMRYFGPTRQEMLDHRDKQARQAERDYLNMDDRK